MSDDDRTVFSSVSRRTIKLSCFETIDLNDCFIGPTNLVLASIVVVDPDTAQLNILHFVNIFVLSAVEEIIFKEVKACFERFLV